MTLDISTMFGTPYTTPAQAPVGFAAPVAPPQNQENRLSVVSAMQGLHTAQPQRNAAYFTEGNYLVAFMGLKCIQSNEGKGPLIIIEWRVVRSTNPSIPTDYVGSHVIKVMGNRYAQSDMRNFVVAMSGLDESRDRVVIERDIMGPDASGMPHVYGILTKLEQGVPGMVGKQVVLRCSLKKTKTGMDFTTHSYSSLPPQAAAQ